MYYSLNALIKGTTGNPKAALLSHHAVVNISYFFSKNLDLVVCIPSEYKIF